VDYQTYTIAAGMTGFKTITRRGNLLVVGTPLTVDLRREVGQATEVVNVESTRTREIRCNVSPAYVTNLLRFALAVGSAYSDRDEAARETKE
jgi:hypothetical protein